MRKMKNSAYTSGLKQKSQEAEDKSIVYWLLMGIALLLLFWAPFQKALFNGNTYGFERPIFNTAVWSSIILILLSIFLIFYWKFRDWRDLFSLLIWLLPLSYLFSSVSAASHYLANNMVYIQSVYAIFFILGIYLTNNKNRGSVLPIGIILSGYLIVWFGFMNLLGNAHYQDAVMKDINGFRLTSVFQYANSYAAFLIAILLSSLFLATISKKWYFTAFHSFMAVPIIVSFLLTLSRGGIVILPVILLLILPFMKLVRQILLLSQLILASIASLIILGKMTDAGMQIQQQFNASVSFNGWFALIAASLPYSVLTVYLLSKLTPLLEAKLAIAEKYRFSRFILPIVAILFGGVCIFVLFSASKITQLLPETFQQRIENINLNQHSVLERGTFYKDSIKILHDYPVLGAGGGAWAALYEKYQNNPYVSRQAHNFFLQYLIETGVVGTAIFIVFIGALFFLYIRYYIKNRPDLQDSRFIYLITAISLLLHSTIDFDLSFVYLGILLFLSLGGMASNIQSADKPIFRINSNYMNKSYPVLLSCLSVVLLFNTGKLLNANTSFDKAIYLAQTQRTYNEIVEPLNRAIKLSPDNPHYTLFKINLLNQNYQQTKNEKLYSESIALVDRLNQKEPFNRSLLESRIQTNELKNQTPKSLETVQAGLINFPWDITLYEKNIYLNFILGDKARLENNTQAMNQYWNSALNTYIKVIDKTKELALLPKEQSQGRPFNVTKIIADCIGRIYYMKEDYNTAAAVFKQGLSDQLDDKNNRITVLWYLAALQKQNMNDRALMDTLIAKDPNMKQELQMLLQTSFSVK